MSREITNKILQTKGVRNIEKGYLLLFKVFFFVDKI